MPDVLVTGANRGIGLEFARQYAAEGWHVIAGCRHPDAATELRTLATSSGGRVTLHALDVEDHATIDQLATLLAGTRLDLLINNAGSSGSSTTGRDRQAGGFGQSNFDGWLTMFRVNVMGPMKMAEAFAPHLEAAGGTVATVSSQLGSMTLNTSGNIYGYRATKAGANAVTKSLAIDLAGRGIKAVTMHPGWVKTDMGGPSAPVEPAASVRGMRAIIAGLTPATSGHFFNFDGSPLPW